MGNKKYYISIIATLIVSVLFVISLISPRNDLLSLAIIFNGILVMTAVSFIYEYKNNKNTSLISLSVILFLLWLTLNFYIHNIPSLSFTAYMILALLPLSYFLFLQKPNCHAQMNVVFVVIFLLFAFYLMFQFYILQQAPNGFLQNKNLNAALMNLAFFLTLAKFLDKDISKFWRIMCWLVLFVFAVTQYMIASRAAIMGFYLGLIFLCVLSYRRTTLLNLMLVIVVVICAYCIAHIKPIASVGFSSMASLQHTTSCRVEIWQQTWQMIQAAPIFGHGLGSFTWLYPQYRLPLENCSSGAFVHNDYLQLASAVGLPGLLLFVLIMLLVTKHQWQLWRDKTSKNYLLATSLFCGLVAVCFHSLATFNFSLCATLIILGYFVAYHTWISQQSLSLKSYALGLYQYIRPSIIYSAITILLLLSLACGFLLSTNYVLYQKARTAYADKQQTYAIQLANQAVSLWPFEQTPYQFLLKQNVQMLIDLGESKNPLSPMVYQQGLDYYQGLIKVNPYNDMAYLYRAKLAEYQPGKILSVKQQQASHAYRYCLTLNSRNIYCRLGLATLLQQQRQPVAAQKVLLDGRRFTYTEAEQVKAYRDLLLKITHQKDE